MSAPFQIADFSPAPRGFLFSDSSQGSWTMVKLTSDEQGLLERLSAEGKVTALKSGEIGIARALEMADLVFLMPDGSGGAVITPRGRRLLAELETAMKSLKKPPSFLR